jgi:2-phospho-L-lactate guanylyltransferase (CobY/MobA/RfbA family)
VALTREEKVEREVGRICSDFGRLAEAYVSAGFEPESLGKAMVVLLADMSAMQKNPERIGAEILSNFEAMLGVAIACREIGGTNIVEHAIRIGREKEAH